MGKSKRGPENEKERDAENHNHKARREQKRLQAELARKRIDDEADLDELYEEDIQTFQKIRRVK